MSRMSSDEVVNGTAKNGFDYNLQAWIKDYKVYDCGHPEEMKATGCCNAHLLAGLDIRTIKERENRRIK